jgi:flagellin-like protein
MDTNSITAIFKKPKSFHCNLRKWRTGARKGISELMATLIMVSITLVSGAATFAFVNGQVGVSASAYGNQVNGNINYLNERANIAFANFPGVGAADTQVTIWLENTGKVTLSSYTLIISGLYCGAASDTCALPSNTITITCTQGGAANCAVAGPVCATVSNTLTTVASSQLTAITLTLPAGCSITFQATAGSPPAPQTVSFTFQFTGFYGSSATYVKNR